MLPKGYHKKVKIYFLIKGIFKRYPEGKKTMPIKKNFVKVGDSQFISIPAQWIKGTELQAGKKIAYFEMECNGSLILKPVFEPIKPVLEHKETLLNSLKKKLEKEPKLY